MLRQASLKEDEATVNGKQQNNNQSEVNNQLIERTKIQNNTNYTNTILINKSEKQTE